MAYINVKEVEQFAQTCADASKALFDGACYSEEAVKSGIGRKLAHDLKEDNADKSQVM